MLADARRYVIAGAWWLVLFPSLAIALAVLSFNLLGDALRDALDPRAGQHLAAASARPADGGGAGDRQAAAGVALDRQPADG